MSRRGDEVAKGTFSDTDSLDERLRQAKVNKRINKVISKPTSTDVTSLSECPQTESDQQRTSKARFPDESILEPPSTDLTATEARFAGLSILKPRSTDSTATESAPEQTSECSSSSSHRSVPPQETCFNPH